MTHARRDQLLVQYSLHDCTLNEREKDLYEKDLVVLGRVVEDFPSAELHVTIARQPRSGTWEVRLDLELAKQLDLFAQEVGDNLHPAFKDCVRALVGKVQAFKERRGEAGTPERGEVPGRTVRASVEPDLERLASAVRRGDYVDFRDAIGIYRESLRKRIGRRIELHPDASAKLDDTFTIDDCVEDVFLTAFENFEHRPHPPEGLGEWLERTIDGSIVAVAEDPEARRNVSFARSAREAGRE